jgi:hypothetical protein
MRRFTLIWLGQLVSVIGSGLTSFALGVWIYSETGNVTPFALTALFATIPTVLVSPLAGALVDRWNRRLVLIVSDTGAALSTLVAALLLLTGQLEIWHIYLVVLVISLCGAFQEPAYTASITLLVPKKDLGRASGMVQSAQALSMLISPLLAGLLFSVIGAGGVMLVDFASFFFAIGALLLVAIPQPPAEPSHETEKPSLWRETTFGWHYIRARSGLFGMLIYFALINFLINISGILIPPLILSFSTAEVLGLVQSASGVAMLAGGILMSAWGGPRRRMRGIYAFAAISSLGLIVSGLEPSAFVVGAGFSILLFTVPIASGSSQAIWQSKVAPAVQGRVFATRSMISRSIMPLAFLLAGPLADRVFEPMMSAQGALASASLLGVNVGEFVGFGPGRGIGLMFILSGLLLLTATTAAYLHPRVRNVEDELPDAVPSEEDSDGLPERISETNLTSEGAMAPSA